MRIGDKVQLTSFPRAFGYVVDADDSQVLVQWDGGQREIHRITEIRSPGV